MEQSGFKKRGTQEGESLGTVPSPAPAPKPDEDKDKGKGK
jgi:hypothetical protein